MRIGIITGAMKPVHIAHWKLIEMASIENDEVRLFVSGTDRVKKNEFPILGSTMRAVWNKHLIQHLPKNVIIEIIDQSPVVRAYEFLGKMNEEGSLSVFTVYSSPEDFQKRFPIYAQTKYFGNLYKNCQIQQRAGTDPLRATEMRTLLSENRKQEFIKKLPSVADGEAIWQLLT